MRFRLVLDHSQADLPAQLVKTLDQMPAAIEFEAEDRQQAEALVADMELRAPWSLLETMPESGE